MSRNSSFTSSWRRAASRREQTWPDCRKSHHRAADGLLDVGVGEDDVGALPPSSSETFVRFSAAVRAMILRLGRAGEGDLVNVRGARRAPRRRSRRAGDDVHHAVGSTGLLNQLAEFHRRTGVCSAGLRTTVFPAASSGRVSSGHQHGKFHGITCPQTPSARAGVVEHRSGTGIVSPSISSRSRRSTSSFRATWRDVE